MSHQMLNVLFSANAIRLRITPNKLPADISLLLETVPMPGWRRAAQNLPLVLILPVFFIIVVSVTCNDSSFASSLEHENTGIG